MSPETYWTLFAAAQIMPTLYVVRTCWDAQKPIAALYALMLGLTLIGLALLKAGYA